MTKSSIIYALFLTLSAGSFAQSPIPAPPQCPCLNSAASADLPICATGPTSAHPIFLKASQCSAATAACAGGGNLMFWQLEAPVSSGVISPQQAAVMALSPVVH